MVRLLLAFFIFGAAMPAKVFAGSFISDKVRFEVAKEYLEAKAGRVTFISLGSPSPGSIFKVKARARNDVYDDINLYICSEQDLRSFQSSQRSQCRGVNKQKGFIEFSFRVQTPGNKYLVLDNSYSIIVKKKVDVQVTLLTKMDPKLKRDLEVQFAKLSDDIQATFKVNEFDFRMEPCGQKNAFSMNATGDITICTELFFDLIKRKLPGALIGIIYHELGHSLLNLWGLPGNEEAADEFAIVMLYWKGAQEKALDWINYYKSNDSRREAENILQNGDRHPLSVQRVRNIKRILNNPGNIISRWNRLLYPHMTKRGLQKLVDTSPKYVDRALMNKYLNRPDTNKNLIGEVPPRYQSWAPVNN